MSTAIPHSYYDDEFVICGSHLFAQHAVAAVEGHDEPVQLHRAFAINDTI